MINPKDYDKNRNKKLWKIKNTWKYVTNRNNGERTANYNTYVLDEIYSSSHLDVRISIRIFIIKQWVENQLDGKVVWSLYTKAWNFMWLYWNSRLLNFPFHQSRRARSFMWTFHDIHLMNRVVHFISLTVFISRAEKLRQLDIDSRMNKDTCHQRHKWPYSNCLFFLKKYDSIDQVLCWYLVDLISSMGGKSISACKMNDLVRRIKLWYVSF